ncbi:c-type cytochrome [Pseudopedobacter beijingensis]|uniref:C-type cytochrome n=1 Tax=Pseudopedobacter beijingensis TaxID=1207056 RepID=A0ABW4I8G2_9SPHI
MVNNKFYAALGLCMVMGLAGYAQQKNTVKKAAPSSNMVNADFKKSYDRGSALYTQQCMVCHQADGNGVPNLNPPIRKTTYVNGDKTRLINILLKGLDEEIEINGEYYSNPMPPFNQLNDQQIADILTYIRNSFENKSGMITSAEVKNVRAQKK